MSKHLATAATKNFLLIGRNVEQNLAHGGWSSASTGLFERKRGGEKERERERERERKRG